MTTDKDLRDCAHFHDAEAENWRKIAEVWKTKIGHPNREALYEEFRDEVKKHVRWAKKIRALP